MQMKKLSLAALLSLSLALPAFGPAEAVSPNPFAAQKFITLDGEAERAYISDRVDALYGGELRQLTNGGEYVPDKKWQWETLDINGVKTERFTPKKAGTDRVMLFLHGGAYIGGQNNLYRDWGMHLAMLAGDAVMYMPDYRLAPHHTHPAAMEDALAVYRSLLDSGIPAEKIIIAGDSAGAHLSLVLLQQLRTADLPFPGAQLLISPWADLSMNLPSRRRNLGRDQLITPKYPLIIKALQSLPYFSGMNHQDALLSPIHMDMQGVPPTFIAAGSDELLLDDAVLLRAYMENAGVEVTARIYRGMSHDWSITLPELKESKQLFSDIKDFLAHPAP